VIKSSYAWMRQPRAIVVHTPSMPMPPEVGRQRCSALLCSALLEARWTVGQGKLDRSNYTMSNDRYENEL